jgi:GH24 family phage-related lysozyme (muramidase)
MDTIYIVGIITAGVVAICLGSVIIDYKLKKKQIEADMKVRIEEAYAKNKLEIDKLLIDENVKETSSNNINDRLNTDDYSMDQQREKVKTR